MKALAIDCAVTRLVISAKNDDKICTSIFDIGMKQSEILVNAIDYALTKVDLSSADLDYTTLTIGPGSFTGLRLAISALKAIELAYDVPVYGISSLKTYEYSYIDFNLPILTGIDANKDKYYARISIDNSIFLEDGDYETSFIQEQIKDFEKIIIAGPDCDKLKEILQANYPSKIFLTSKNSFVTTENLFELAEKEIAANNPPLKDYDGPVYLRASEAEIAKNAKSE